jgi:hypothetical protein
MKKTRLKNLARLSLYGDNCAYYARISNVVKEQHIPAKCAIAFQENLLRTFLAS